MLKIKHARTADCVVAGFRWHKTGKGVVRSLLLGLYDDRGTLHHVGVTSSFTMEKRRQLATELEPLRQGAMDAHPWRDWAGAGAEAARMPGAQSRWSAGKDLSWQPLRSEPACEVKYDHLQGDRFRHAAVAELESGGGPIFGIPHDEILRVGLKPAPRPPAFGLSDVGQLSQHLLHPLMVPLVTVVTRALE
jgi:ATP-dependent DNA ligase